MTGTVENVGITVRLCLNKLILLYVRGSAVFSVAIFSDSSRVGSTRSNCLVHAASEYLSG